MSIIIIKSIFSPDTNQLQRTLDSLESLKQLLSELKKNNPQNICSTHIRIIYTGFSNYPGKLRKQYPDEEWAFWDRNYGKTKTLNYMIELAKTEAEPNSIIYYFDHDILFPPSVDIFQSSLAQLMSSHNIGLLAFDQSGDPRHQLLAFQNQTIIADISLSYPEPNMISSIALGGFAITAKCLKKLASLPLKYVYGIDDMTFLQRIQETGMAIYVKTDMYIIHPLDTDTEYQKWKHDRILETLQRETLYDENLKSSELFWNRPK